MQVVETNSYKKLNEMSLMVRLIKYGFDFAMDYAHGEEIVFIQERMGMSKDELIKEYNDMKIALHYSE